MNKHNVTLTNEQYHYISELLAHRASELSNDLSNMPAKTNVEFRNRMMLEESLVIAMMSEQFISI